ncbi:MAG: CCA tRNA nucleotidyltransferase [Clostridia bacterium]|nr:CCA tRNA nucleotidyltransferase [Clostridia bacterium]
MDKKMYLSADVNYILAKLLDSGYEAYVVGGAVRDFLLGDVPGDYDITTSAEPCEIKEIFKNEKTVDTGIKHGTVSVVLNHKAYEITTYRIDGEYLDARHPESVSFTRDISEDLARRDFTVNAMAYNERSGLVDLFSGEEDLKRGIIRAVGSADKRFEEDALRILRALRFASKLDFKIEKNTSLAIFKKAHLLSKVAKERVYAEWVKLLSGKGAYRIINEYIEVIKIFIPELNGVFLANEAQFCDADFELRFVSLFAYKGAGAWEKSLNALHSDNKIKLLGKTLLENFKEELSTEYKMKLMLSKIGEESTERLIKFKKLCEKTVENEEKLFEKVIKSGACFRLSEMKISGNELNNIGITGRKNGEILAKTLDAVMKGEIPNEREALLGFAVKLSENE